LVLSGVAVFLTHKCEPFGRSGIFKEPGDLDDFLRFICTNLTARRESRRCHNVRSEAFSPFPDVSSKCPLWSRMKSCVPFWYSCSLSQTWIALCSERRGVLKSKSGSRKSSVWPSTLGQQLGVEYKD
jgi:hypothetical protein